MEHTQTSEPTGVIYHIVVYNEGIAECDCLYKIPVDSTVVRNTMLVSDLIHQISTQISHESQYQQWHHYLNSAKTIRFGPRATKRKQIEEWSKLTEATRPVNIDDFVFEHYDDDHDGIFFIIINQTKIKHTQSSESPKVPKTESKTEPKTEPKTESKAKPKPKPQRKRRKRARNDFESKNDDESTHTNKNKKRRRLAACDSLECLWLLTDASLSGCIQVTSDNGEKKSTVDRFRLVTGCIETIANTLWGKEIQFLALYSFGKALHEVCSVSARSMRSERRLLGSMDAIEESKTNAQHCLDAIAELIDIIESKQKDMCCSHRIVLFVSYLGSLSANEERVQMIHDRIEKLNIIFDVIQVSRSHRPNPIMVALSQKPGKLWSPSDNKEEWNNVVTCDCFVNPKSRNMNYEDAIVISD